MNTDFSNSEDDSLSEYEYVLMFNDSVIKHMNDEDISDVLKIWSIQNI